MKDYLRYSGIGTGIAAASILILRYLIVPRKFERQLDDVKSRNKDLERIISSQMIELELLGTDIKYRMDAVQRGFNDDELGNSEGNLVTVKADTLGKILYGDDARRNQ